MTQARKRKNEGQHESSACSIETLEQLADRLVGVVPHSITDIANNIQRHYRRRTRKKRDGSNRTLRVPVDVLKTLQRKVAVHILHGVELPEFVYGGVQGRSMRTMVEKHSGKKAVLSLDISDFFPSVTPLMVQRLFSSLGISENIARLLTKLTTIDGGLPQGAPTSLAIANLVLGRADMRLAKACRQNGFTYTRWVDDLYFSGTERLRGFSLLFERIITEEGFSVKAEKKVFMTGGVPQIVLRLVVNRLPNLPREVRSKLRAEIAEAVRNGTISRSVLGQMYWARHINPDFAPTLIGKAKGLEIA